jgi:hypothetical protein
MKTSIASNPIDRVGRTQPRRRAGRQVPPRAMPADQTSLPPRWTPRRLDRRSVPSADWAAFTANTRSAVSDADISTMYGMDHRCRRHGKRRLLGRRHRCPRQGRFFGGRPPLGRRTQAQTSLPMNPHSQRRPRPRLTPTPTVSRTVA